MIIEMKRWRILGLICLAMILIVETAPATHADANTDLALDHQYAHDTVHTYFDSLRSGNLDLLSSLFGTREQQRTEGQLLSPGYSQFLSNRYETAVFTIGDYSLGYDWITIDIKIQLNEREAIYERLYLKDDMKQDSSLLTIYSREELLDYPGL